MTAPYERRRGPFLVSTEPGRLDRALVHRFLTASYWAKGIPPAVVDRSIEGSIPFGLYHWDEQIGFARVVTDRATFAYLADVFVLPERRGAGLGRWLVECVMAHPDLQGLRRFLLATRDAHALYERFGFAPPLRPHSLMERFLPDIYARGAVAGGEAEKEAAP
jgi:GNAT superfamily N-acetyltransferase